MIVLHTGSHDKYRLLRSQENPDARQHAQGQQENIGNGYGKGAQSAFVPIPDTGVSVVGENGKSGEKGKRGESVRGKNDANVDSENQKNEQIAEMTGKSQSTLIKRTDNIDQRSRLVDVERIHEKVIQIALTGPTQ